MRRITIGVCVLFAAAMTAAAALADTTPNFHSGPTCSISSSNAFSATATCTGTLYGVGNQVLKAKVILGGDATYTCRNHGGNVAPGQKQVHTETPSAPSDIRDEDNNGAATFTTNPSNLAADQTVSGDVAGCPNGKWTGVSPQLTVTSIELLITQHDTVIYDCSADVSSVPSTVSLPKSC